MALRILLADGNLPFRQGLRTLLERSGYLIAGEASSGNEALTLARELRPDVDILGLPGPEPTRELRRISPTTKIIVLSVRREPQYVADALRAGAAGYVLKRRAADDLTGAVNTVSQGGTFLPDGVCREVVEALLSKRRPPETP